MNPRIKLISDTEVKVQRNRHSVLLSHFSCSDAYKRSTLLVNHNHFNGNLESDSEGNDAELEVRQCWKDTGLFAALRDTSDAPYRGKKMRVKLACGDIRECTVLDSCPAAPGFWIIRAGEAGVITKSNLLPLVAPPPKKYRPWNKDELYQHIGTVIEAPRRRTEHLLTGMTRKLTGEPLAVVREMDRPQYFEVTMDDLVKWTIDSVPCGMEES